MGRKSGARIRQANILDLEDCELTRRLATWFFDMHTDTVRLSTNVNEHFRNLLPPMPGLSELDVVRQSRRGPPELRINATLLELEGEVHISYLCDTFFDAVYPLQFAMENEFNSKESWPHE